MARKIQLVSELADQTAREVTQNVDNWKHYLHTASRLYKYSFNDQLLIYAQRPDATACAAMEIWNDKMRRWVKAGAKGIALIHESESGRPRLEYVFDVADTRPVHGAKMPYLWEMRQEYHASVLTALENQYGESSTQDLGKRLMEIASFAVKKIYPEYLRDLDYDTKKDFLEGLNTLNVKGCFGNTLTASVQYTLLVRCGLEPSDYLEDKKLEGITAFSTPDVLHHLGDAVSTLSMGILQEIGKAIRTQDKERLQNSTEKAEKPLEKIGRIGYTKDKEQFNTLKRESVEGRNGNGRAEIQEKRGLPDTRPDAGRRGRNGGEAIRKVRDTAAELPKETPPRDIHLHAADWTADAAPVPDRPAGTGTGRPDNSRDDETGRRERGIKGSRSDGMASGSEQFHGTGGRNRASGNRVSVIAEQEDSEIKQENQKETETAGVTPAVSVSETKKAESEPAYFQLTLFPTVEEQVERIAQAQQGEQAAKTEPIPSFSVNSLPDVPENVIARALTSGGNKNDSILRIVAYFQKSPSLTDAATFLSEEYGTGGKGISIAGKKYALWFDKEGIRIAPGLTANIAGNTLVSWEKAAALINQLLESGTYAGQEKLDAAQENEYTELAEKLWFFYQNLSDKAREAGLMPSVIQHYKTFTDDVAQMARLLMKKDSRDTILEELTHFNRAYQEHPEFLRFRNRYTPEKLLAQISSLNLLQKVFYAIEGFEPCKGGFITEDEITDLLKGGSGISERKMQIYSYFVQGHDTKECADFLRKEYGDGGHGYIGYNEWHDSKGIQLTRSDDFSSDEGYDTVKINWNQVQKRIRGLIDAGTYLSAKEQTYMADYEKLCLARKLYTFFYYDPRVKQTREWDINAAECDFKPLLDSPKHCETLYEDMVETFALISEKEGQKYQIMKDAIEAMASFQRGEYSLFTPLSEETLQAKRMEREAAKQAKSEKSSTPKQQKEPAGELEAAARALSKKQKGKEKVKERADGQLTFDFAVVNKAEPESVLTESVKTTEALEAAPQISEKTDKQQPEQKHNNKQTEELFKQNGIQKKEAVQQEAKPDIVQASEMAEPAVKQSVEMVEIEGGQIATAETESISSRGLPYEIVVEKLHFGTDRHNYHITEDTLGTGGQKSKFQNNIAAIQILKQIEAENRLATSEEQETLAKYVGWGGLAQAFDAANEKWATEYAKLKELLTPEEYESARSTVLNAHYTSPTVIKAMYEAVGTMEFTPGNILEPSCGIGNFFGLVPEKYQQSNLYGVELDSLTGRIAKQLYQKAGITIGGFEKTEHPDDFFDLAIGNVPFGEYKVHDKRYDKQNLFIHDYFLTKTLDKVRPGGVVAFITTKGTLDKANSRVREGLAQKADLLGAIRLPNNAFKANAGTEVTCDILFFQKRGSAPEKLPDWVQTGQTEDGVPINKYYLQHPEMVLGKMSFWENMYGNKAETACLPIEDTDLAAQLSEAVKQIAPPNKELLHLDAPEQEKTEKGESIPADPNVRNFSFAEKDGKLYFRENSRMTLTEQGKMPAARIKGMIGIRDSARKLIDLQLNGAKEEAIQSEQARLNLLYDNFQKKYGRLNSSGNRLAFRQDSSYPLLCSLEVLDEEGNFKRKADMFSKRTIQHRKPVTSVDTAVEALGVSIGERACVDLDFMASLMGGNGENYKETILRIVTDLKGIIFKDPDTGPFDFSAGGTEWKKGWKPADEYLSGNVRQKLETARKAAEEHPEFAVNVEALESVQPKDLTAPEISVRIGAPWIDTKYYKRFLYDLLETPYYLQNRKIDMMYSDVTGEWRLKGKREDSPTNARVWNTYGTKRINAYEIFEASLNQRSVQIFDTHYDTDGKESRVLNEKETAIAQQKQDALKEAFQNWIFKAPDRRADLCATYNKLFNSTRPREYDGQHIHFIGMNPEIRLERHQRNAVARVLYGGNTLLAHVVGAGKTFEMIAAAMESKRLGLCKKSMIVVPNHLTEQWGSDFLTLYPGAKVLVATKKDFEPKNRKKFCARIATGDYDAVIIGHSQFEKIPISPARQEAIMQAQIEEIVEAIREAKINREENFTIKQMEKTKKVLETKIQKLYDKKKDDTVYFEELGVDRLFVDEAHSFKNLYMHTKMRNVAGISQTDAQKSSDMFAKCRYMDELTGGRGVVFATGTPVSNSMVELYTMMRYLQYNMLEQGYQDSTGKTRSLKHFDNWAATFGEQVTAVELKPEGTGFRLKTRFARFYNLPELISRWKEAADIQTADMLKLPVPEVEYITVQTEPSEAQKLMVKGLADRAEKIRKERIDPRIDNMLKITSDGRKLALDQRIINPLLPDDPGSKVNACVNNVFQIWKDSTPQKGTQLIFSDLSTPRGRSEGDSAKNDTTEASPDREAAPEENAMEASVYEDIRTKLIAKGIPAEQIAFIHNASTEAQKAELFAKVRSGQVRVLLGSTQKMGAGTNVQTKLIASHDLDCPWRPADLEQRAGRIVRRGNENNRVKIFRYVTKGTFDAYTWGLVESKQKFIGQVMTSKSPARSIEDVDATALTYAEVKMLAIGDTRIKEKMDLDIQVTKLKMLKSNHLAQQYEMQDKVRGYFPNKIKETRLYIDCLTADLPMLEAHPVKEDNFSMAIMGTVYTERKEAGKAIIAACRLMDDPGKEVELGEYRGFPMKLSFDGAKFKVTMKQNLSYTAELSNDVVGNVTRINNALEKIPESLQRHKENLDRLHKELESAKEEADRPFAQEQELAEKTARLAELNTTLDQTEKEADKSVEETIQDIPVQEGKGKPVLSDTKSSVLQTLRECKQLVPAQSGAEHVREGR